MDLDDLLRILASFEKEGLEYALIGAVALNLHGIARTTEDLDLFIRPTAENVERLRRALRAIWDDPHIAEISTEDLLGDFPAVRYLPPGTELYLDILTRLGEFARYEDLEIIEKELSGVRVRVASPASLYRLKKGTVRVKDRLDAELLREKFDLPDEPEGS